VNSKPLVTVTVLCYNFEKYIDDCLSSIVRQITDFPFLVIVGDDCSTDGSRKIIEKYAMQYPELIKTVFLEKNVGAKKNIETLVSLCESDYIAHCDGDDYFYPDKLQRQVNALQENPGCSMVFHKVELVDEAGESVGYKGNRSQKKISAIEDLVMHSNYITHSSKMYRRSSIPQPGFSMYSCARALDYLWNIESASSGNVVYIDQALGAYRKHNQGVDSAPIENHWRNFYGNHRALEKAKKCGVNKDIMDIGYANMYLMFARRYAKARRYKSARKLIVKSYRHRYIGGRQILYCILLRSPRTLELVSAIRSKVLTMLG